MVCILQCNPIHKYWDSSVPGKCADSGAYTVSTSSIVLATDLLILIMPSCIIHDLRMPLARKLTMIALLSFGVAVTIVGAVRTSVLVRVFVIRQVVSDPTYGVTYTLSNIESGLAIFGACGPTIKYMLSFCCPSLKPPEASINRAFVRPSFDPHEEKPASRYTRETSTSDSFQRAHEAELNNFYGNERTPGWSDVQIGRTLYK